MLEKRESGIFRLRNRGNSAYRKITEDNAPFVRHKKRIRRMIL